MKRKFIDVPFDVKAVSESGSFEGYGSVFGVEDSYKETVMPGAFEKSLKSWAEKGRMPALLWQHRMSEPIGAYHEMREDKRGLYVRGQLAMDVQRGREAHSLMKMNALSGLSIGFVPTVTEIEKDGSQTRLMEIDLWEVSPVTFPANDEARIESVKAALDVGELPTEREFEHFLRDAGFSSKQAKRVVSLGYKGIGRDDSSDLDALAEAIRLRNQKLTT